MMRINKYLADRGIATRREADRLITAGQVFVNGTKAVLGDQVSETDEVTVRGKRQEYLYYVYNKPTGIVTSTPQKGETDIVHHTHFPGKVFPIGRLDKDSHGVIIMTNDGRITSKLLDPDQDHEKEYEVTVDESVTAAFVKNMSEGVLIKLESGNYITKPCVVKKIGPKKFSIILTEGKKRQIRRMCESLECTVTDLVRTRIGKIKLGALKEGTFKEIPADSF
jgi:23S rRNA pseudouridine2604 synthase